MKYGLGSVDQRGEEAGQPAREALRGSITEALLTFGQFYCPS